MKYNKGEWSEAYTFVKLLGEGEVYSADEELNKNIDEVYPILKVIRDEIKREYKVSKENNLISMTDLNGEIKKTIDMKEFLNIADVSLLEIKAGKSGTFEIPILKEFLNGLEIIKFKSKSRNKSDFKMEILDLSTQLEKEFTFSIKSELGSPSTLLNASNATSFLYEIENISDEEVLELNSIVKKGNGDNWLQRRMIKLLKGVDKGNYKLRYVKPMNDKFDSNLKLIDSNLDLIIAHILVDFSSTEKISDIKTFTERLTKFNPLGLLDDDKELFYKTKVIELIKASTFGMMPSKKWDKEYEVNGGILNVKKNGDVVCHHIFYDKKALDEFLYRHTKLETASTSRYGTGNIFKENGKYFFVLNLQIRMKY